MARDFGPERPGDATETRGMAERAQAHTKPDDLSGRTFLILLVIVVVLLGGFALYLTYGR